MRHHLRFGFVCLLSVVSASLTFGRPIDPAIDDGPGPFCYISRPSTVLGVADGRFGTQITGEGWPWTGAAELVFMSGQDLTPLRQRVQTLVDGHLPIVKYSIDRDGIRYSFTMFGATLDGKPESELINFIRVRISNPGKTARDATFAAGFRAEGPGVCQRMRQPVNLMSAKYAMGAGFASRDGEVVYTFPEQPAPQRLIVPDAESAGPVTAAEKHITAESVVGVTRWNLHLAPGGEQTLDFKMPYHPVAENSPAAQSIEQASFDKYLGTTTDWWTKYLAQGAQIELPERKVTDTLLASLMYDSIARDKIGDDYVVTVNEFQYHHFWVRDGSYIVMAFDLMGRHNWAQQSLDYFLKLQQPDGIIYQPPQLDGWGQALWVFGQHWRLTGDLPWARRMYPYLVKDVRAIEQRTRKDPLGLVPPAPPYDNEAINGHYTGHSLHLLAGLRDVIAMAKALGETADVAEFQAYYNEYLANFLKAVKKATATTGGYLPPGIDAGPGCDWGNLLLTYPRGGLPSTGTFEPTDPIVSATVDTVREKKYAEGIMTYGPGLTVGLLHDYLTMKVTENLVTQNRQRDTLADFYSVLTHTTSTQGGFEFSIKPWDNRDPGGNFPPHGWFAAKYCALLRNMLIREWDGDLHLFTVLSPDWVKPGATIAVRNMPTEFGDVTAVGKPSATEFQVNIDAQWRLAPKAILLHIPWFVHASSASADGRDVAVQAAPYGDGQQVQLPPGTKSVIVRWQLGSVPNISYDARVAAWKAENRQHFDAYVKGGGKPESLWREDHLMTTSGERNDAWTAFVAKTGIAVGCAATASSSESANPPSHAVDGVIDKSSYWGATPYPAWWQVDLGRVRRIDRIRVVTYWGDGRYYQYKVQLSTDGKTWQLSADMSRNTKPSTSDGDTFALQGMPVRYVRVDMLKNSANPGVHLVEVQVFAASESPVVAAPQQPFDVWTAEKQTGSKPADVPNWSAVNSQRIVLHGAAVERKAGRVRLQFRAGAKVGIAIDNVSIARTSTSSPADIVADSRIPVTFNGSGVLELPAGGTVWSDWEKFDMAPGTNYSVSFDVLRTGGTVLWADPKTERFQASPGAALSALWSQLNSHETYNLYFLSRIEGGE